MILGSNYVISFQEWEGDVFSQVRERLRSARGQIRSKKSDYLMYSLIDSVVDRHFSILEALDEKIHTLEEAVVNDPNQENMLMIHHLKKEMIFLRRSVWPLRELLAKMDREDFNLICKDTKPFIRDIYDHAIQVIDIVETLQGIVSGLLIFFRKNRWL